ncbi:hypothetical protein FBEOM_6608 [Fusarium beomiforme]|uniref:F-box domain-containing protein n=1 Tax=Fusarium beomiforme TaxID=44412 RepID=A0A9P5AKE9_9HYPO|nr:hypothetical protein FBEOM_6608 [Fusarium beomiforme]
METEPPEEATVAVARLAVTPASLSVLEQMPTEILCMIGSHLYFLEIKVASLASKHLRSVFLRRVFKNIRISGDLTHLAYQFRTLLRGESRPLMDHILSSTNYATICFKDSSLYQRSNDSHLWANRIAVVSEFIFKISPLKVIAFDFKISGQEARTEVSNAHLETVLGSHLRNTPKWNGPRTVAFTGPRNFIIYSALLSQFAPNSVEAICLPAGCQQRHRKVVQAKFPSLKGLKVNTNEMEHTMLHSIRRRRLLGLESLVLERPGADYEETLRDLKYLPKFSNRMDDAISALKAMPRLRRFAFRFDADWVSPEFARRWESPVEEEAPSTNTKDDEERHWLTDDQKDVWFSKIITRILDGVPHLAEVCVRSYWMSYRGIKTEGVLRVRGFRDKDPGENSRFPHVLLD